MLLTARQKPQSPRTLPPLHPILQTSTAVLDSVATRAGAFAFARHVLSTLSTNAAAAYGHVNASPSPTGPFACTSHRAALSPVDAAARWLDQAQARV